MKQIPHGTIGGYTNHACRCDLCKQAHKDYRTKRRELDPEGVKAKAREQMRRSREKRIQADREAYLKKAAEQQAEWRKQNPQRTRELQQISERKRMDREPDVVRELGRERTKRWKEKNPEGFEANRKRKCQSLRLRRYQLSPEEYAALLEAQCGVCAICGKVNGLTKHNGEHQLVIDHCHDTGAVRGLLCYNCNLGLGNFKDDRSLLKKAIDYLEND